MLAAHLDHFGAQFGSLSRPVLPMSWDDEEAEYKPVCHRDHYGLFDGWLKQTHEFRRPTSAVLP